jgi:hypothetical protein
MKNYNSDTILKSINEQAAWRDDAIRKIASVDCDQKSMRRFLVNQVSRRFERRIKNLQKMLTVAEWHEKQNQ